MNIYNKFIYKQPREYFCSFDVNYYNHSIEIDIQKEWEHVAILHLFLKVITLGFAAFFLKPLVTKLELKERIQTFSNFSKKLDHLTRKIQKIFAKNFYKKQKKLAAKIKPLLHGAIDIENIWDKITQVSRILKNAGYYVFYHAHSFPIKLYLDLSESLQTEHQSNSFKRLKVLESRQKFRAPDLSMHFKSTTDYLNSSICQSINEGKATDNHHREIIISCDGIASNKEVNESARYYFENNKSFIDSETGVNLDSIFIQSFIKSAQLQKKAEKLLKISKEKICNLSDYGVMRIIAIPRETIQNQTTNYVWCSHRFGVLCRCQHSGQKYKHEEFLKTLKLHQKNVHSLCQNSPEKRLPQYRILASNLDRDQKKQIYTLDCLTDDQKRKYDEVFNKLRDSLAPMIQTP